MRDRGCFIRAEDGRILGSRPAGDDYFTTAWLRDPGTQALFREQDRRWNLAHGVTEEQLEREERRAAAERARMLDRMWRRGR